MKRQNSKTTENKTYQDNQRVTLEERISNRIATNQNKKARIAKQYQELLLPENALVQLEEAKDIKDYSLYSHQNSLDNDLRENKAIFNHDTVYFAPDDFKTDINGNHSFDRNLEFQIASPVDGLIRSSNFQGLAPKPDLSLEEMLDNGSSFKIEANKLYRFKIMEYTPIQFKFDSKKDLYLTNYGKFYKFYDYSEINKSFNIEYIYNPFGQDQNGKFEYNEELSAKQDQIIKHNSDLIRSNPNSGEFFEEKILTTIAPTSSDPSSVTRMSFGEPKSDTKSSSKLTARSGIDSRNIVETSPTHLHPTSRKLEIYTPNTKKVLYGAIFSICGVREVLSSQINDLECSRKVFFNPGSIISLTFDRNIHHRFIRNDLTENSPRIDQSLLTEFNQYNMPYIDLKSSDVDMMMGISAHGYDGPETVKACQKAEQIKNSSIDKSISSVTLGSTNSMLSLIPKFITRSQREILDGVNEERNLTRTSSSSYKSDSMTSSQETVESIPTGRFSELLDDSNKKYKHGQITMMYDNSSKLERLPSSSTTSPQKSPNLRSRQPNRLESAIINDNLDLSRTP